MARNKYTFKKRQKELAKMKKKEEKMKRKLEKGKTDIQTTDKAEPERFLDHNAAITLKTPNTNSKDNDYESTN